MRPRHKSVQPAKLANQFVARPKIKMISVREDDLSAERFEILLRLTFHRGGGTDGHEGGSLDYAMRSRQPAKARTRRIDCQNFKMESHPWEFIRRRQP